jgi:hypothetical protein
MKSKKLKIHSTVYATIELAKELVNQIPKSEALRLSIDITALVGCVVEDNIPKTYETEKKDITTQILNDVFSFTEAEILIIHEQYDYLKNVGKIKKTKLTKKIKAFLLKIIKSFFLITK